MPSFATKFGHQKRALLNEHSLNYLSVIFVLSTVSISLFLFVAFSQQLTTLKVPLKLNKHNRPLVSLQNYRNSILRHLRPYKFS